MSVKLHDGYQLGKMSLTDLHKFRCELRDKIGEKSTELYAQLMTKLCVKLIDDAHILPLEEMDTKIKEIFGDAYNVNYSVASMAYWGLYDLVTKAKNDTKRDMTFDLSAKAIFMPVKGRVLALFYAEKKEYRALWESFPCVTEYGYWDNTDRPERISARQWNTRKKHWKEATNDFGPPADCGFEVDLTVHPPMVEVEQCLPHMSTWEERVEKRAHTALYQRKMKELDANSLEKTSDYFKLSRKIDDWTKSDDATVLFQIQKTKLAQVLPKVIDIELLSKPIREIVESRQNI